MDPRAYAAIEVNFLAFAVAWLRFDFLGLEDCMCGSILRMLRGAVTSRSEWAAGS